MRMFGKLEKRMVQALLIAVMATLLTSCASKEAAINQFEQFSYELRDNSAKYNKKDWEKAAGRFKQIRTNLEKYDYTPAERQRIGRIEGQCLKYMANGAKENLLDKLLQIGGEVQGILEGIGISK